MLRLSRRRGTASGALERCRTYCIMRPMSETSYARRRIAMIICRTGRGRMMASWSSMSSGIIMRPWFHGQSLRRYADRSHPGVMALMVARRNVWCAARCMMKIVKMTSPQEASAAYKSVRRVAAYCRVSTLKEEQEESRETQTRYYNDLISSRKDWRSAGIYVDDGISGTQAKKRPGFMKLMEAAEAGRIDLILVKSLSRFSRNALEALEYLDKLKAWGVEVRFDREGFSSLDANSEMLINIMAALAQEESRSISQNIAWSLDKNAIMGIRHVGNNRIYGYDEVDGKLTPNGDAWVVGVIFESFVAGESTVQISKKLKELGAKSLRGKDEISPAVLRRMLANEVYIGDRLIQKRERTNYLTKKPDPRIPYVRVYVSNDHEPIIDRELWTKAQNRLRQTRSVARSV